MLKILLQVAIRILNKVYDIFFYTQDISDLFKLVST